MNRIGLIIKREFLSRVKKKSFLIMTLVGPILMAGIMIAPALIAKTASDEDRTIIVLDETNFIINNIKEKDNLHFKYLDPSVVSIEQGKEKFKDSENYGLLYIPYRENVNSIQDNIKLFIHQDINLSTQSYVEGQIESIIVKQKLLAEQIEPEKVEGALKTNVNIAAIKISEEDGSVEEKESRVEGKMGVGFVAGFLIYLFIFLYGAQVMRGVIEEKSSRIVEVIISSVKPFQLMMGKIIGIAAVGLTQFLLWIILTFTIITVAGLVLADPMDAATIVEQQAQATQNPEIQAQTNDIMSKVSVLFGDISFSEVILSFLFYFIGGYLLYGALFAAIGSAVDNEADTQQFMLPVTMPMILAFVVGSSIIENPHGPTAFWFSMIPFTSPVVMMVRIPFGVPLWEILLSMSILIATFIGAVWFAGRIYRVGILMYGKKPTYKELIKWARYKG